MSLYDLTDIWSAICSLKCRRRCTRSIFRLCSALDKYSVQITNATSVFSLFCNERAGVLLLTRMTGELSCFTEQPQGHCCVGGARPSACDSWRGACPFADKRASDMACCHPTWQQENTLVISNRAGIRDNDCHVSDWPWLWDTWWSRYSELMVRGMGVFNVFVFFSIFVPPRFKSNSKRRSVETTRWIPTLWVCAIGFGIARPTAQHVVFCFP